MGVKAFIRRPRKQESVAFTIGTLNAELTDDVIKEYKLGPALKRIGEALAKQYARRRTHDTGREVIGVHVRTVGFNLLLGESRKEQR